MNTKKLQKLFLISCLIASTVGPAPLYGQEGSSADYVLDSGQIVSQSESMSGSSLSLEGESTSLERTSASIDKVLIPVFYSSSICGNGTKEGTEECDTSDFGSSTCQDYGFDTGILSCTSACKIDTSTCSNNSGGGGGGDRGGNRFIYCGNFKIDKNEECDDGNKTDGDGCSSTCLIEETEEEDEPDNEIEPEEKDEEEKDFEFGKIIINSKNPNPQIPEEEAVEIEEEVPTPSETVYAAAPTDPETTISKPEECEPCKSAAPTEPKDCTCTCDCCDWPLWIIILILLSLNIYQTYKNNLDKKTNKKRK